MPIPLPTTPEQFCWLYAVGCLEYRHQEGSLEEEDYLMALEYLKCFEYPPSTLVRDWFPKPFEKIKEKDLPCTLEEMQNFWRKRHTVDDEKTPVFYGKISSITTIPRSHTFVRIAIRRYVNLAHEEKSVVAQNLHGYDISIDDEVIIHGSIVAEKV